MRSNEGQSETPDERLTDVNGRITTIVKFRAVDDITEEIVVPGLITRR